MQKDAALRLRRARPFTPRKPPKPLDAFTNPAFRPWMALRGWAAFHTLIGTGWVFVAVWLDDHGTTPMWTVWGCMLALWFVPLIWIHQRAYSLRSDRSVPKPRTLRLFVAGVVAFEVGSGATLLAPSSLHGLLVEMLFLNLAVAIWVTMTGLSFLVTRIPFSWREWCGAVLLMVFMLPLLYLGTLYRLFRG